MIAQFQKSFHPKSLMRTLDRLNVKMVKTLTGGHGMKNMEKSGTGLDQRLEKNLNPTGSTRRVLTTSVFTTKLTVANTCWP